MRPLGRTELDILEIHVNAGDRVAYYSQLADWGYEYGSLALGVVNNDTLAGRIANEYFTRVSERENANLNADELVQISLRLMQEDFIARERSGGELPVDVVTEYHERVFAEFGVSGEAWTPFLLLASEESTVERQEIWDSFLGSTSQGGSSFFNNFILKR